MKSRVEADIDFPKSISSGSPQKVVEPKGIMPTYVGLCERGMTPEMRHFKTEVLRVR